VPSEREVSGTKEQIWEQIKMQICASDAVLAINTVAATRSQWIPLELEAALSFGKEIVAVCPDPRRADRPSRLVEKCASMIVAWRVEAVVDAIQAVYAESVQKEIRRWRFFKDSLRA
ncbi:MAG: TIR domain-containing protein, partial [Proteobacteria bacterium]|nr:TIR domain-containing protein [Pseudomonadota bacterium]